MTSHTTVSLSDLQSMIKKFVDERDWDQFHNPKDLAISLSLEASELLEHFQWKNDEEIIDHLRLKKADVADELADVLYWVLLMSNNMNIDLVESFAKKMKKNEEKYPINKAKGTHKKYSEL